MTKCIATDTKYRMVSGENPVFYSCHFFLTGKNNPGQSSICSFTTFALLYLPALLLVATTLRIATKT